MKKIAILGASYLQRPLVEKANELGLETYVFAWKEGNVVEDISDYFYPISVLDKDAILKQCKTIGIDGITSIASDIAMPTVNYVASKLGLIGNSLSATLVSTDKFEMRKALVDGGIPCPKFKFFEKPTYMDDGDFTFPVIVKPTNSSGSRGVTKVQEPQMVNEAIAKSLENSINNRAIVEEFIVGREFSVEIISYKGNHYFLAITDKVTSGEPYFVEIEHHQPATISEEIKDRIIEVVKSALDVLQIKNGASHSEILLTDEGDLRIVEIACRMGGELIGSDMVKLSTGFDFVRAVIEVALGEFEPINYSKSANVYSGVYYVLPEPGTIKEIIDNSDKYDDIIKAIPILKVGDKVDEIIDGAGKRAGIFVYKSKKGKQLFDPNTVIKFVTE